MTQDKQLLYNAAGDLIEEMQRLAEENRTNIHFSEDNLRQWLTDFADSSVVRGYYAAQFQLEHVATSGKIIDDISELKLSEFVEQCVAKGIVPIVEFKDIPVKQQPISVEAIEKIAEKELNKLQPSATKRELINYGISMFTSALQYSAGGNK